MNKNKAVEVKYSLSTFIWKGINKMTQKEETVKIISEGLKAEQASIDL